MLFYFLHKIQQNKKITYVQAKISKLVEIPGSACHMGDEQGKGRDIQTGLAEKGGISCNL